MNDAKTEWGTVRGTASAAIDEVIRSAQQPLTNAEIFAEVARRGLPLRKKASPHLNMLKSRGYVTNLKGKWFRVER